MVLSINVRLGFRIAEAEPGNKSYQVTTTNYFYTLLDRERRELLAYHHHPEGAGWCTYPHLHVGTASGIIDNKAHLVTGPVTLPAFIRMLIEDPAIPIVSLSPDWDRVLAAKGD